MLTFRHSSRTLTLTPIRGTSSFKSSCVNLENVSPQTLFRIKFCAVSSSIPWSIRNLPNSDAFKPHVEKLETLTNAIRIAAQVLRARSFTSFLATKNNALRNITYVRSPLKQLIVKKKNEKNTTLLSCSQAKM